MVASNQNTAASTIEYVSMQTANLLTNVPKSVAAASFFAIDDHNHLYFSSTCDPRKLVDLLRTVADRIEQEGKIQNPEVN